MRNIGGTKTSLLQVVEDTFSQSDGKPGDGCDLFDGSKPHSGQTTELFEKYSPFRRADARDVEQLRCNRAIAAPFSIELHGESMRFVSSAL